MATLEENRQRQQALEAKFGQFLEVVTNKPGFVRAGIGFRRIEGQRTDEICFVVLVEKKLSPEVLTAEAMIPDTFDGERIDVVEYVKPQLLSGPPAVRPLVGGIQCNVGVKNTYGTLGCCAKSNDKTVLLSNHHVLYGHGKRDGDTVYQPNESCCGCRSVGKNVLGKNNNLVDAAIAELDGVTGTNKVRTTDKKSITITGTTDPVVGMRVQKTGATTGHTWGRIINVFPKPTVAEGFYVEKDDPNENFSAKGDSGSVVITEDMKVVGLLWGGLPAPPHTNYICKISDVMSELNITIPSPDLVANNNLRILEDSSTEDPRLQKYEDELNQSANGRGVLRVLKSQADEVGNLVHHNRAVTVAWMENKGPEFIDAYRVAEENPTQPLPKEVDGVTLQTMLSNMADVLEQHGSDSLKADIVTYKNSVLNVVDQVASLQQLTDVINGDAIHCWLVNFVWQQMWTPASEFYLPTAAKNGLKIPELGVDIQPFDIIKVGDLPELTMFKEPVLGYMKILLSNAQVSGLDTAQKGTITCQENDNGSVTLDLSLTFRKIIFSGDYNVSAGGGIVGCTIAAAAAILGGSASLLTADPGALSSVDQNINLALWYRSPLAESDNGQILLGAYEEQDDTIYDLQQEPNNPFNQALTASNVQSTTSAVTEATQYYQAQQTDQLREAQLNDAPPTIGTTEQYASGQLPYAYLIAMARAKVRNNEDPDNRYAKLEPAMTHYLGAIDYVQKNYPGEHPVGGDNGVLQIIANSDPQAIHDHVMAQGTFDLVNPENQDLIVSVEPKPLDYSYYQKVYQQSAGSFRTDTIAASNNSVDGTFEDEGVNVSLKATITLSGNLGDNPQVDVSALSAEIGALNIKLQQTAGWWPGLYDKVTNWIANTFVTDILKSHINDALASQSIRDSFAEILEGITKKKG